jgi:two-component system sensor kinase
VGYGSDLSTGRVAVKARAGGGDGPLLIAAIRKAHGQDYPDPCRIAMLTGRPVVVQAIEAERDTLAWKGDRGLGAFGSMMALPLEAGGRSPGHISVLSTAADTFDEDEVTLLTELTTDLAFAIKQARARAAASRELRHLREEVEQTERRRIAATLHDGVAQSLQAVNLGLRRLRVQVAEEKPSAAKTLDQLIREVADAIGEVREVSQELRPRILERLNLHEAIALHCSQLEQRAEIRIPCLFDPVPGPIDDRVKVQCFLGFREALGNALKHANATRIDVTLAREEPGLITICVADNGQGFDIPRAPDRPLGLGLAMITERAEGVGGRAEIQSVPGKGTRVRITAPFSAKAIPPCP